MASRIVAAVEALAGGPRPAGARKLAGSATTYRVRVGDYRTAYSVFDDRLVIEIVRVGHRREVYRR